MPVSIVEQDGRIAVCTPYHPSFPARARGLGGIWDSAQRVWIFDAADHDRVRSLCREVYGTDGPENGGVGAARFLDAPRRARSEFAEPASPVPHYYGHRRRLRERMIEAGAESLPDYELLEMLLFAANPQGDMKPTAKALLARISAVLAK